MKCLVGVGVNLNANSKSVPTKPQPKITQPRVVQDKALRMSFVARMNDLRDDVWRRPRTKPKSLTFAHPATAIAEVREGLIENTRW
jgi:hypothetical protein